MKRIGNRTIKNSKMKPEYKNLGGFMHIYLTKRPWQNRAAFSKLSATL